MARQSFISHVVNGYSRYDVPESKAFTCTPGILYPVRIDFINARDRVSIAQGIDVRSNPLAVPSFNPYTIRLHRFWVPMQLYHPEMRTNSSKFDMNNVSLNWTVATVAQNSTAFGNSLSSYTNSLFHWLRISNKRIRFGTAIDVSDVALSSSANPYQYVNADTYLAYWDIVRNYYSYSQWGLYSFSWPGSFYYINSTPTSYSRVFSSEACFFTQRYGNLEFLDSFFESQFYPNSVTTTNNTYNRLNLFPQIIASDLDSSGSAESDGYPVSQVSVLKQSITAVSGQFQIAELATDPSVSLYEAAIYAHPMAVVPSNPDRFSRLIPNGSSDSVSMTGVSTIPQLAIASRLQEYKDLLGAGGNRFSDWLETFFASRIEHVDRPKLLFSASQTVNVQVVMNQSGQNNFADDNSTGGGSNPLGQQGGSIAFNSQLGRSQSYYFREPGYMIDMLSIRPVYYWAGIRPDYQNYQGSDYFNPIYNDIGYQDVPAYRFGSPTTAPVATLSVAKEACFNEFRASYDEVLGQISVYQGKTGETPLYSYWVQQRSFDFGIFSDATTYYPALFVDMTQANSPFVSKIEDNFFINLSYSVRKKNLVNKTFATRLSNR